MMAHVAHHTVLPDIDEPPALLPVIDMVIMAFPLFFAKVAKRIVAKQRERQLAGK